MQDINKIKQENITNQTQNHNTNLHILSHLFIQYKKVKMSGRLTWLYRFLYS